MTDVNLGDVVEVLDPLVSPTVHLVVLPLVQFGGYFAAFQ